MIDEQVIRIIATKGPILPAQLAKETGSNTMIAGAVLSKLVSDRKLFISHTKIGGSPVYYLREQAYKLQELYNYLNEKDKKTFEILKSRRIMRDAEQDALTRVSLRQIKDFAVPLEVTLGDKKEIFWKWYMTNDPEATELIRDFLKNAKELVEAKKEKPAEKTVEHKREEERLLTSFVKEEKTEEKIIQKKEKLEEPKKAIVEVPGSDAFADKIIKFLKERGVIIKNIEIKKKNSEIDLVLSVPSIVGDIDYYCRAKNKAKISDSDLSSAYVQGQLKKLPAMLITSGVLTKKASQMLEKEIRVNVLKI